MANLLRSGVLAALCMMPALAAAQVRELPRVETTTGCFVQVPDAMAPSGGTDCGYVVVAQSRSGDVPGGEVRLAYMRIRAVGEATREPLFMLAGGPGKSIVTDDTLLLFRPELLGPVLATRDIVLMEQRGTFRSRPSLDCPEVHGVALDALTAGMDPESARALGQDRIGACIARHRAAGVDFASYNNVESAADVDDVRAALGYDRIVYYGSSYATLLGGYVMRAFPESLAAVILDGTDTQANRSWIENRALNAQWGIDNLTRLCADQQGCAGTFDIPALLEEALDLFDEGPITVSVPLPDGAGEAAEVQVTVTDGDLAQQIYALQTSKYGVSALPIELQQLVAGGREALGSVLAEAGVAAAVAAPDGTEIDNVSLMHAAMVCSDDAVRSIDEIRTEGAGRYAMLFARTAGAVYVDLCRLVDVPQLPDSFDVDVETDVPVLILSGGLDVQTPYFLSEQVASHLPRATHVIFPAGFHVQIANINRCAVRIARAFLDDPEVEPDAGCVAEEQPLPFVMPEQ